MEQPSNTIIVTLSGTEARVLNDFCVSRGMNRHAIMTGVMARYIAMTEAIGDASDELTAMEAAFLGPSAEPLTDQDLADIACGGHVEVTGGCGLAFNPGEIAKFMEAWKKNGGSEDTFDDAFKTALFIYTSKGR